jgi:hypothetical protein
MQFIRLKQKVQLLQQGFKRLSTIMFGYKFLLRIFTLSHKRLSDKRRKSSKIWVRNKGKRSQFTAPVIVMFLAGEEAGPLNPSGEKKKQLLDVPNEWVRGEAVCILEFPK